MNASPFVEYKQVRQEPGPGRRRWFQAPQGDLMVWYDAHGRLTGLQFCHAEGLRERAYTWRPGAGGWRQQLVESGSSSPMRQATPILIDASTVPLEGMKARLAAGLDGLEPELAETVRQAIL